MYGFVRKQEVCSLSSYLKIVSFHGVVKLTSVQLVQLPIFAEMMAGCRKLVALGGNIESMPILRCGLFSLVASEQIFGFGPRSADVTKFSIHIPGRR